MNEIPHRAIDDCLEWEDRAKRVIDEEEVCLEAMKIYLAALEEGDGANL